jgi:sec-independent protein translocase protein TatA
MLDSKILIVILVLAVIVFGTRRLRSMGSDLGSAVKGFRQAMQEGEKSSAELAVRDSADR